MRRALAATGLVCGLLLPAVLCTGVAGAATVPVRVDFGGGGRAIPAGFFGLSTEYNELPTYERSGVLFNRMLDLLRPSRRAPLTLRIGGKSADHMLWEPTPLSASAARSLPRGVFQLGQNWLDGLDQLVSGQDLKVILDLNLAVHSPSMAAGFASAVRHALPGGRLAALEIGNEPDMYHYQPRLTHERVATTSGSTPLHWWSNYTSASYRRDYQTYARSLRSSVPGIRLGAPDITRPNAPWLTGLTGLGSLGPAFLAIHRYGASGCFSPASSAYPTVPNMLNDANSSGLAASVAPWVRYAHARRMGLRVSEINSVSCGRDRGVANSFATALWAPDTLFSMIKAGVNAVSWHIRPQTLNAPFHLGKSGLRAEPELYGLALFATMTQGSPRLLSSSVSHAANVHLRAWAVRSGHTVRVLLINKGWQAANVSLKGRRGTRTAHVRWLTAPGVHATGGVRFAAQRIGSDGLWHGRAHVGRVRSQGGRFHLRISPYSAAMVTL